MVIAALAIQGRDKGKREDKRTSFLFLMLLSTCMTNPPCPPSRLPHAPASVAEGRLWMQKENDMTTSQALRAERRAQRERMERDERARTALAALFLIALLGVFAVAGTMDYHDEQVYRESWYEAHGID